MTSSSNTDQPAMAAPSGSAVFAFEVSIAGTDFSRIINARSRGKAKQQYHCDVLDCFPDLSFTRLRCRKVGRPHTSHQFRRNAEYRGMPSVECGQRVLVGSSRGVIVGHNSSANFDVLFDDDAPKYAGLTLNCHPSEVVMETQNSVLNEEASFKS